MDFIFPTEQIPSFPSLSEIKAYINQLLLMDNLTPYVSYRFRMIKRRYIYCICKICNARMVFKKEGELYILAKANLKHQHNKIKTKTTQIIQTIKDYPMCFNVQTMKQMTMARFNISSSTFYRYLARSRSFGQNIQSVLTSLQSQGIFGVKINSQKTETGLPALLLLTSQLMIQRYHQNGRNIKFDLTYNLVRQKSVENKQYSVGAFVTQNSNLNIQPVGLVIMEQETKESFIQLFYQFIYLMKESPRIVITDEQKTIQLALQQLKERNVFTGHHFIDIFHILRNAKKGLFHKPSINYLISLSRSTHQIQYQQRKQKCLLNMSHRDQNLFTNFLLKLQRSCIAKLPAIFIGLSCTTNSIQKLNDIIKQKLPYSLKYIDVVPRLSKLLVSIINKKKQINFEKIKVENFLIFPQIHQLRFQLCKTVFRRLMRELSFSTTCIINCTENPHIFIVQEQEFEDQQSLTVKYSNQSGIWACECQLTQKIGIPCAHIIKVMLLKKQSLIKAINSWWIVKKFESLTPRPIMPPRKTRRNFH